MTSIQSVYDDFSGHLKRTAARPLVLIGLDLFATAEVKWSK